MPEHAGNHHSEPHCSRCCGSHHRLVLLAQEEQIEGGIRTRSSKTENLCFGAGAGRKWWAGGSQPVPHCYSHMESSSGQVADHMSAWPLWGWSRSEWPAEFSILIIALWGSHSRHRDYLGLRQNWSRRFQCGNCKWKRLSRHQLFQLGKEGCKGNGFGLLQKIWHVQQPSQLVVRVAWAYFQFSQTDSVETEVLLSPCLDRLYSNQLCMNSVATEKLGTKGKSSKVYRNSGKQTSISKT